MTRRENRNNEQLVVDENEETEDEELEPPHEVITYVDQKALLRKQNFRDRSDDEKECDYECYKRKKKRWRRERAEDKDDESGCQRRVSNGVSRPVQWVWVVGRREREFRSDGDDDDDDDK